MAYNAAKHTTSNKPYGVAQDVPTDARSYFYDESLYKYRPYQNTAEALLYLDTPAKRGGNFPVFISSGSLQSDGTFTGGTLTEYWFKDGVGDGNLVAKTSGGGTATRQAIADTVSVPFNYPITHIAPQKITAPRTYTPDPTGATGGYGGFQRAKADGVHIPVFSGGFVKWPTSGSWSNVNEDVNLLVFWFDGVTFWYGVTPPNVALTPLDTPDAGFDMITGNSMRLITSGVLHATLYQKDIASDSGFTANVQSITDSSLNHTFTGLSPDTAYYGRIIARASGYADSPAGLAASYTSSSGDTTPPTVTSITAIDATHFRVVFSETVVPTTAGWSFGVNRSGLLYTCTAAGWSGSGTTWDYSTTESQQAGDVITAGYNSSTGNTVDTAGNELVTFSGRSVTNSISGGSGIGSMVIGTSFIIG